MRHIAKLITENIYINNGQEDICRLIYESILNEDTDLIQVLMLRFPTLAQTLKNAKINPDQIQYLASGDKGAAFIGGNKIIKITEDHQEAMASANLIGQHIPGINHIYSVTKFANEIPYQRPSDEEPIPTQYYMIIQDILNTKLSLQEKKAANAVGDFLSDYQRKIPWPFNPEKILNLVKTHTYQKKKEIIGGPIIDKAILSLLKSITNLYAKNHIKLLDISSENVGKNENGDLTIFDLGISESPKTNILR